MALGSGWRAIRLLPADAADAKPYKLVATESGEQPGDDQRPYQGQRIPAGRWEILSVEVDTCPEELGPNVIGDESWLWPNLSFDGARDGEDAIRIKPPSTPALFPRRTARMPPIRRAL